MNESIYIYIHYVLKMICFVMYGILVKEIISSVINNIWLLYEYYWLLLGVEYYIYIARACGYT
jgi:hypothetical protein